MAKLILLLSVISVFLVQGMSIEIGRIVGGEVAEAGEFPWQVSLRGPSQHFCGGSLVSLQHVLTAAHCVAGRTPSSIIVVTGTNSLETGGEEHAVRTIFIHASYSSPAPAYHLSDVSVLVLNAPIVESQFQRPITLAIDEVPAGVEVVLSGWGRTLPGSGNLPTDLQKLSLTIVNQTECQNQWSNFIIQRDHVCGVQEYGAGICNGDSGSALVYNNQVVGIASWANPCGFDYPDVFTNVFIHLFWIGSLVHNTDTETTTLSVPETSSGNQLSMTDGLYVLQILCIFSVIEKLFFTD